jgi:hypothetical protein
MDPHKPFTLAFAGVLALFGGDAAISAMATVNIYQGRRWLGWYNSPGSYFVAEYYGRLAKSKLSSSFSPGITVGPTIFFHSAAANLWNGPKFIATRSGTNLPRTEHTGYLFLMKCKSLTRMMEIEGRQTSQRTVTVVELGTVPDPEVNLNAAAPRQSSQTLLACLVILSNVLGCVVCGIFEDWYSFSMILLGIMCSGISGFVIGSGSLIFHHPRPAVGSPPGDGILQTTESDFVVLLGEEGAVNAITRGRVSVEFPGGSGYRAILITVALFTIQSLLQLLLIPQGTLLGQTMFMSTLAISWVYNSYISSFNPEMVQANALTKVLGDPVMQKYRLGTHTAAVVFVVLALQPPNPDDLFNRLLPDTETWKIWKRAVGEKVQKREALVFNDKDFSGAIGEDMTLLRVLFSDATDAYHGYVDYLDSKHGREKGAVQR